MLQRSGVSGNYYLYCLQLPSKTQNLCNLQQNSICFFNLPLINLLSQTKIFIFFVYKSNPRIFFTKNNLFRFFNFFNPSFHPYNRYLLQLFIGKPLPSDPFKLLNQYVLTLMRACIFVCIEMHVTVYY